MENKPGLNGATFYLKIGIGHMNPTKRRFIYCIFYANKKRLGGAYIPEGSTGLERKAIARSKGIMNHNAVVFHDRNIYVKQKKDMFGAIIKADILYLDMKGVII